MITYIIDGQKGAGKSTLVAALAEHFSKLDWKVKTFKPKQPNDKIDAVTSWWNALDEGNGYDILIIDRGLGTEFIYGKTRNFDQDYFITLEKFDLAIKEDFRFVEVTLIVDKDVQVNRGRVTWKNQSAETQEKWLQWGSSHSNLTLNSSYFSVEELVDLVTNVPITKWNSDEDSKMGTVEGEEKITNVISNEKPFVLDEIFLRQEELMRHLEIADGHLGLASAAMGLGSEAGEVLDICNVTKGPWAEPLDHEHLKEELVDVLFYVVEMYLLLGLTSRDMMDTYLKKWNKNMRRAKERKDVVE